ncbi:MAG: TolC family protein [Phycisphaerae bacterium]|jgi:outer membrane protein TolC
MKTTLCTTLIGLCILLSGCISDLDSSTLNRYQQALVQRGPAKRAGQEGVEPLRPLPGTTGPKLDLHTDPNTGKTQVYLTMEEAIIRTLANSLDIRVSSYDPAISREQLKQAEAAFDVTAFGGANISKSDIPSNLPSAAAQGQTGQLKTTAYAAGLREFVPTGGTIQTSWQMTRTLGQSFTQSINNTVPLNPVLVSTPYNFDAYEQQVVAQVTQPLLRNAGIEYNMSQIKLAALNDKATRDAFRQKVEETVNQAIIDYLGLIQARVDVQIQQELLDATEATFTRVKARQDLDATAVQIKQTEAAVQRRLAVLIAAQKAVGDAQDALARLMADSQINLLNEYEIIPVSPPITTLVTIDRADKLITALKHNPVLDQARLAIEAAIINVYVAQNQTLPRLDLNAATTVTGASLNNPHGSSEQVGSGNYVGYALGLSAEYPIGNRAAIAQLQQQKYNRLKAVTQMQNLSDQLAQQINERIRTVRTAWDEMLAQRASVEAAKVQLQALDDTEKIRGRLTPEFLQLKLQAQEEVAQAQHDEVISLINYNAALSDLDRATGTILDTGPVKIALPPAIDEKLWPAMEKAVPIPTTRPTQGTASDSVYEAYRRALTPMGSGQLEGIK